MMVHLDNFGSILKDLIIEKETSVSDLSKVIEVDESVIYRWCKNSSIPNLKNLIQLSDYFQCSIDYLVGKINNHRTGTFKDCPPFSERLKELKDKSKLTLYRICKDTKVARNTLTHCFNGTRLPLIDNLIRLADYFGCSIDFLVGREN